MVEIQTAIELRSESRVRREKTQTSLFGGFGMPFTLIKGTFEPSFGRPDGDSLRFVPDDPSPIFKLRRRGRDPKLNRTNGSIQLRYESIDTMESKALASFSDAATKANLDLAGTDGGTKSARGHIFSNQLGPHGRPIAFVFAGDSALADGKDDVFLEADDIQQSINVQLLKQGHAYPLFYDTLFKDLRVACTDASEEAREGNREVWSADASLTGATWTGDVSSLPPIYPKLWRRIDTYVRDETFFDPTKPFANLKDYVKQLDDERVLILSENKFTGFDNVIETTDHTVKLLVAPRDLVVVS